MGKFQMLNYGRITFDFFPESSGEVKSVSIISDGELSGGAGGSPEEADFSLGIGSDAVSEAGQGDVAKYFQFLKGHG